MEGAAVSVDNLPIHVVIPDSQVKPGMPTDHLRWIGQFIVDQFAGRANVKLIHLGDFADMQSLSLYDKGKKSMEGRRYKADIAAANAAFDLLNTPLDEYNARRRELKERQWWPERHMLHGNHEDRITRAVEADAQLEDLLSLDDLNYADHGWEVHPFLVPVEIDGVSYCHYFYNPMNGRAYGGQAATRLKTIGFSFTMGHQQLLDYAIRNVGKKTHHALIAGACYLHDEDYKGPQGNDHFRGIVICYDVEGGSYSPHFIPLDYLCRRYEGMRLDDWKKARGL